MRVDGKMRTAGLRGGLGAAAPVCAGAGKAPARAHRSTVPAAARARWRMTTRFMPPLSQAGDDESDVVGLLAVALEVGEIGEDAVANLACAPSGGAGEGLA